jgi:sodium/hydrogen antiporter
MSAESLAPALALIGIVILVSSLLSGVIERTGIPQVAIFLLLGVILGPAGLKLGELTLESPTLQQIATLALVLVLFTDAIAMDFSAIRRPRRLLLIILAPATLIPAGLIALAAWLLLDLGPLHSLILGAALASTDPVMLRSLTRRSSLPATVRESLRLEGGINDVVLLPIVVLSMLGLHQTGDLTAELGRHAMGLFLLGPILGGLVGFVAITVLEQVRKRVSVRRDYESLYALGVAFTAYAAAEAVGGSGFLAAFAAGLVIASLDVELCDCFLDYGQATAEMFLLFTFVAFGAGLIWSGFGVADPVMLVFAGLALLVRTLVLLPVLAGLGVDRRIRRIIAWAGPRGLSSLLLVLLPVFAGAPGSERLFTITCLVVLLSVALHGTGIALFLRKSEEAPAAGAEASAAPVTTTEPNLEIPVPERITLDELRQLQEAGAPLVVADVRTDRSYAADNLRARGAVRLPPDDAVRRARQLGLDHHATVVLYCA